MPGEIGREYMSGVLIPAPPEVDAFVRRFRERYPGTAMHHVPPHITLMVPFVPPGRVGEPPNLEVLDAAATRLRGVCRQVAPFPVCLDHYGMFPGGVLYLALRDDRHVTDLHRRIQAAFPDYPAYGGQFNDFVPHMTLDVYGTDEALAMVPRPSFAPFEFTVSEILIAYGDPEVEDVWAVHATVPLED
jgi:2'-5' RNA ligase